MRRIRSADTKPEWWLRQQLFRRGYRYRVRRKDLPGKPDLVFPGKRKVIFVHGCFWHQHDNCRDGQLPKSRQEYWGPKLRRNVERDKENLESLKRQGWEALVVWACEIKEADAVLERVEEFLRA